VNPTHPAAAATFLRDPERSAWHDEALWFVRQKRDSATALPEWETLRDAGAALKAHAMSRLAELLETFESRATAAGVTVHWARDAAEHNAIVLDILRSAGATRVAKSKSMLTEECGLNPVLEANGIEVVDTDLGERIVQLAHEPPSHIVLPAIHWKKRLANSSTARWALPRASPRPTRWRRRPAITCAMRCSTPMPPSPAPMPSWPTPVAS
jgi:L-lactate dehydrogenase complex protein LldF